MRRLLPLLVTLVAAGGCADAASQHHVPTVPGVARATAAAPAATLAARPPVVFADGLGTPTSFAFGAGRVFAGDAGATYLNRPLGGVFVLRGGTASRLAGSPPYVGGLAWRSGTLYVSGGPPENAPGRYQILAWSGWNGTIFTTQRTIYTAPPRFEGFNGLAFGPDGRLYVGADATLRDGNDHGARNRNPYLYDVLSLRPDGRGLRVFARGIRQPWQLAFPPGSDAPLVTDLGQDSPPGVRPPDLLLRVRAGQDFGFPSCNGSVTTACRHSARPLRRFPAHVNPMGIAIIGQTIYLSEFGTGSTRPRVIALPLSGSGPAQTIATFTQPIVGLAAHGRSLFVGETDGRAFRIDVR